MKLVSDAINILDPSKDVIDKAICRGNWKQSGDTEEEVAGKCGNAAANTASNQSSNDKFSLLFSDDTTKSNYKTTKEARMGPETSGVISKDVSGLNRDQKGVVSSAFAKAHEGAEIALRWQEQAE